MENARWGEPPLDEFNMLGDNWLDDWENPYTKWVASNILVKDGHLVDDIKQGAREAEIDVDSVMEEFRMSSSESRNRQLHYDDQAFDVESSCKSGSSSNEGDGTMMVVKMMKMIKIKMVIVVYL